MEQNFSKVWFFLLINTKSGGGWGKCYLQLKKQQFSFSYKKQKIIYVKLIDLFDKEKKNHQLKIAKQLQKSKQNDVRVIICGGDGTIIWGIQQCLNAQLNFQQLLFASLPIGTGNDFTRTIGWGGNPLKFQQGNILPLKKRIIQWILSEVISYDVWEVQITVYQKGQIYSVKNRQDFLLDKKVHKVSFVNYVGIGADARCCYHFHKHRKSTKLMNIALYTCLGFLFYCKKIPQLENNIQQFQQCINDQKCEGYKSNLILKQHNIEDSIIEPLTEPDGEKLSRKINLKKGYYGLICLNSISYLGGEQNVWQTKKVGCKQKQVEFKKQEINDGIIEFIGYKNQLRLVFQKLMHTGARVAQGEGPFIIKFKQESYQQENYIQIDGEGFKFRGIKQIAIRRHSTIPNSKIKVMFKKS